MLPSLASIVTAAYLTFSPQPAEAQQSRTGKWYMGVLAELGKPQSPDSFTNYFGRTGSFGIAGGRLPLAGHHLTGDFSAQYTRFFGRNSNPIRFNALEVGVEVRIYPEDIDKTAAAFYAALGANITLSELTGLTPQQEREAYQRGGKLSEQRPALIGGAGLMMPAGKACIDFGVRIHYVFTAGEPTVFTTAGLRLHGLFGNPE